MALLSIYNTTLPPKPVVKAFDGVNATTFPDLSAAYTSFLGTAEQSIGFDGLSGVLSPTQFTISHGVTFSNLTTGGGALPEGSAGSVQELDGYDGTFQPDGDTVYVNLANHSQPLTFQFATPVASVGSFVATGVEGTNHTLSITAFDTNSAILKQFTVATNLFGNSDNREAFWSITTDFPVIAKVSILNNNPTDFGNVLILDELAWSTTPAVSASAASTNNAHAELELDMAFADWGLDATEDWHL